MNAGFLYARVRGEDKMGISWKKIACVGVAAALGVGAIAGCAASSGPGPNRDAKNAVDPKAMETLPKAESGAFTALVATMPYKAGEGYWHYAISDLGVLQMTKMEASDYSDADVAAGKEIADVFNFSPRKSGEATITLTLEKDKNAVKTCKYAISVDENLNATVTGYEGPDEYEGCLTGLK